MGLAWSKTIIGDGIGLDKTIVGAGIIGLVKTIIALGLVWVKTFIDDGSKNYFARGLARVKTITSAGDGALLIVVVNKLVWEGKLDLLRSL